VVTIRKSSEMYFNLLFSLCFLAVISGAALADEANPGELPTSETAADIDENDPFEKLNRFTSGFNRIIRGAILDPLVDGYQAITPEPMQEAIGNAASNLSEPVTAISSLLSGDPENAGNATKRFIVNSTIGLAGTNDKATEMGIVQRREDLGQAAAVNGAEAGPYIVLPLLGPSNTRDAFGTAVTAVASPMPLVGAMASGGVEYSGSQDDIQAVTKGALDPYTVEKNAFRQYRAYQIKNGEVEAPELPTFDANLQ